MQFIPSNQTVNHDLAVTTRAVTDREGIATPAADHVICAAISGLALETTPLIPDMSSIPSLTLMCLEFHRNLYLLDSELRP